MLERSFRLIQFEYGYWFINNQYEKFDLLEKFELQKLFTFFEW